MLFGLSNAPASFQGYINKILAKKLDIFWIVYLDNILIYIEDSGKAHVTAVRWLLDLLRKNIFFANLEKCQFPKDKIRFLGYVVSAQRVRIEDENIEVVKNYPEPKSVCDIQVFIRFANFYWSFILSFSKIAAPLTSMLKMIGSPKLSALKASGDGHGDVVGGDGAVELRKNLSKSKKPKNAKSAFSSYIGATGKSNFLMPEARKAFNRLRQVFTCTPIFWDFHPECHIQIKTNASGYAIGGILSQLISDEVTPNSEPNLAKSKNLTKSDFGQWHLVAYFSRKMIPAEIWYKNYDDKFLTIVEAFKTFRQYLEGCKYEVFVLTNDINLCRFINTKNLSSRQVRWVQELSWYHFRIDYWQSKANGAADTLSCFPKRSQDEEEKVQAENTQTFPCLQFSLTSASFSGLSFDVNFKTYLLLLYQDLIYKTHILSQLRQFYNTFWGKLVNKTRPALVEWGWGCQNCRHQTMKLKKWKLRNWKKAGKKLREYYTTKAFHLYSKSLEWSWSLATTITLWLAISDLIRLVNSLAENSTGLSTKKTLRPMSRVVISF